MAKWRDVKHKKNSSLENTTTEDSLIICASIPSRIKAFIVDMFMIMMPLAYLTTYIFMDGKDDFAFEMYSPEDCPMCKEGSVAIKPGSRGN